MSTISLKCNCGQIEGHAYNITPTSGNNLACCCQSCQDFVKYLGCSEAVLDECGATKIYQTSQSQIKITKGETHLRSLRLTPGGLLRFYAGCCQTPMVNVMKASVPFAGIFHSFIDHEKPDQILGPVRAYCQTQDAISPVSHPKAHPKFPIGITLRIIRQILMWKLQGKARPTAFFGEGGNPIVTPIILSETS